MKIRSFLIEHLADSASFAICPQVNETSLNNASHDEAIAALKNADKVLELTVLRDSSQYSDDGRLYSMLSINLAFYGH